MKTQFFRFVLCSIFANLTCLNLAAASSPLPGENGIHFCGFSEHQSDTRRYARSLANLDVGEPRTVRMIHFVPNDRQPGRDIDEKFDASIRDAQQYYANIMEQYGFGRKTFRFETDNAGNAVVHKVNGKFGEEKYRQSPESVSQEFYAQFDASSNNIYLCAIDFSDNTVVGSGWGSQLRGTAVVSINGITHPNAIDVPHLLVVHELGHAFGLVHVYRNANVNSLTPNSPYFAIGDNELMIQNICAAEWLDMHHYFNTHQNTSNENTDVQIHAPTLAVPPLGIRLRFTVTDPDGLYQAQLYTYVIDADPVIIDCKQLNGASASVEFVTDLLFGTDWVALRVMDRNGNFGGYYFPIDIAPLIPPSDSIFIPDANLALEIREKFGLESGDPITRLHLQSLRSTWITFRQITNLTGLQHAINIELLSLGNNQISDITLLAGLTKLRRLSLYGNNQISDITPLAGLTKLTSLDLGVNNITDLTPLAGLTELGWLYLKRNNVTDISPLVANAGLGSGDEVHLDGNPLSYPSIYTHIPVLQERGVEVFFDSRTPTSALKITGDQQGTPGAALTKPFVVEVRDANGSAFEGVPVTFIITAGGGTLSVTSTTTDENGRAKSTLTLGPNLETNSVSVSAAEIEKTVTFTAVARERVIIPDSNLLAAVASTLGKASDAPITPRELVNLTRLVAKNANIGDLTGLDHATNLTWLNLGGEWVESSWQNSNSVSDLSPLTGLTKLTGLTLNNNNISDISVLSGLTNLTSLNLSHNSVSDISAVAGLAKLTGLTLNNNISDISVLSGLTNLTSLNLSYNSVSDLSPLTGLTNLTSLNLSHNSVSDISAVAGLTKLTSLSLWGNNISNIAVVAELTKLKLLELAGNNISDISVVAGLTNLTFLNLGDNNISDISVLSGLTNLTWLLFSHNSVSDISAVAGLTNLTSLSLSQNSVSDISVLSGLTNLTWLGLSYNSISDISPLVANTGLGSGATVSLHLHGNSLSYSSIHTHIPTLQEREVEVYFDDQAHPALLKISGDNQVTAPGTAVANPFVVEALDENGSVIEGISVTFTVTAGGGTLSVTNTTTDENGRAESILTLGPNPGTNTVTVSAAGIPEGQTFNAVDIRVPKTLEIISGNDQEGLPGAALENPFVVEVRDRADTPVPGVQVTFSVTSGGGTLSATSVTTDVNGRAESILMLGPNPGTNTVEVGVTGIQEKQSVSAIAELPPIPQDVNRDDVVNILDLVLVASVLGDGGRDLDADVNRDGVVNILDLVSVAGALGDVAAAPSANARALAMLTAADVGQWLVQAQEQDLTDATSREGVLFLEQLFAALTPKETALLPNFPNPFNPETWMPYQLAEDSNVTLIIRSLDGQPVRRLKLGHQTAGTYYSRSRAAYWDGKNKFGEQVASGVYFYTLTAGDYSATRKMLIIK